MRRLLPLALLTLCTLAPAWGAPTPLPVRSLVRQPVAPFPGGGQVPAYRLRAGAPGAVPQPQDLAFDAATEVGPAVRRILGEVGDDPQAAYRWVRDKVVFEPYHGVKRGAEGVAWEKVGNDFDQAALLAALLRSQGVPCRFVYGVVRVQAQRFAPWYGVSTEEEAYRLAVAGGTPIRAIRVGGRLQAVEVNHCWLEARLPYFNPGYRGQGEKVWIALDPSYKRHDVTLGIDLFPRLGFDEEEFLADYLATPRDLSPEQYFRDVLRGKLSELGMAGGLSQAAYQVRVVPEGPGELPCKLSPDVEVLGVVWEAAVVPRVDHYRLRFTLWDGIDDDKGVTEGDLRVELPTAFLVSRRLALVYRPASPADQALADASPTGSPLDATIRGQIRLRPVLLVDGRPLGEVLPDEVLTEAAAPGPAPAGNIGTQQLLLVETLYAGRDPPPVDQAPAGLDDPFGYAQERLVVGQAYAFGTTFGLATAERMAQLAAELQAERDGGSPETVLSSVLSLAALQYLHRTGLAARIFARLLGVRFLQEPAILVCGVQLGAGDPFFDVLEFTSAVVSRDGRADREKAFRCLLGMESSFQEHKVLEDVFRTTAVSTMRIFKRGKELGLTPVLVDATNIDAKTPLLLSLLLDVARIRSYVMGGWKVRVEPERLRLERWEGTGYAVWQPGTWDSGYMITGEVAGGNLSGTTPVFLFGLSYHQVGGTRFTVVHSLWTDPELPEDERADVAMIDLAGVTGPVLTATLLLPDDDPPDTLNLAGLQDGNLVRLPAFFVVPGASAFKAVGLWLDPGDPTKIRPRTLVLRAPASDAEAQVERLTWTSPDGGVSVERQASGKVSCGVPTNGQGQLRADVTAGERTSTGYARLVSVEAAAALARQADPDVPILVGPPGQTHYYPDAQGALYVPFDQLTNYQLADGVTIVAVTSDATIVGYGLSAITQPGTYKLWLILPDGSFQFVTVLVGKLDLVVDADNDDGFQTNYDLGDEMAKSHPPDAAHPGKIIGVTNGDSDGDGVPDFADGFGWDGSGSPSRQSTHRLVPLRLTWAGLGDFATSCQVRFLYDYEDATTTPAKPSAAGKEIKVFTQDVPVDWQRDPVRLYSLDPLPGQPSASVRHSRLRLWTKDGVVARNKAAVDADPAGDFIANDVAYPLSLFVPPEGGTEATLYVEALDESGTPGDLPVTARLEFAGSYESTLTDQVRLTAVKVDLQMYSKNDINLLLYDAENERWEDVEPFYFWVNDDKDGTGIDGTDNKVNGLDDLLDIAPFAVRVPTVLKPAALQSLGFVYRLSVRDPNGTCEIRVFPNKSEPDPAKASLPAWEIPYGYLRTSKSATVQQSVSALLGNVSSAEPRVFDAAALVGTDGGRALLAFEGVKPGKARFCLELVHGNDIVASDGARVELPAAPNVPNGESVHALLMEWSLRSEQDPDALPLRREMAVLRDPAGGDIPEELRQKKLSQCIFYLHGFNEYDYETRKDKFGPVFKRLFWAGIKVHRYQGASFIGVHWPGDEGYLLQQIEYNDDVFHAFYAGQRLGKELKARWENGITSGATFHVIAVSLGSLVGGEAANWLAQNNGRGVIRSLSLLEGAVSAAAFDTAGKAPAQPRVGLQAYAAESGWPDDRMWKERWADPVRFFGPNPSDLTNPEGMPPPTWTPDAWRMNWVAEAWPLIDLRKGAGAGADPAVWQEAYEARWTRSSILGPWSGVLSEAAANDDLRKFNYWAGKDEGPEVSEVLRWGPDTDFLWYKGWLPIGIPGGSWLGLGWLPAWRSNQDKGRPEGKILFPRDGGEPDPGSGSLTDLDGFDVWDEDLPDAPWKVEDGVIDKGDLQQRLECRNFAELAHYFNDLAMPAGVNAIPAATNMALSASTLSQVMKAKHDYFVNTKEYYLVYPEVWRKLKDYMTP